MISCYKYLFAFILSFSISFLLTPQVRKLASRRNYVKKTNSRSIHIKNTPCIGGVAIYFSFLFSMMSIFLFNKSPQTVIFFPNFIKIMIATTLLFIMGFIDDIKELRASYKLLTQISAALILVIFGMKIGGVLYNAPFTFRYCSSVFLTILWVLLITNAVNLIDGLDGISGGTVALSLLFLFLISIFTHMPEVRFFYLTLCGSIVGFLKYNFSSKKIFMGDSGSQFLGFSLAAISIFVSQKTTLTTGIIAPLIILGIPVADVAFAITRRSINRVGIFTPDKNHIHHKILRMGFSPKNTVLIYYSGTALLGCIAFFGLVKRNIVILSSIMIFSMIFFYFLLKNKGKS